MIEGTIERKTGVNSSSKLRFGMVGGGIGSFIGDVHRKAIAMDSLAQLEAGCFSRDWENNKATGEGLGLSPDRIYANFEEMAEKEASRSGGIDFVVISIPNSGHYPAVKAFLSKGIPVVCDKPFTVEESQARELAKLAREKNLLLALSYTYTGYPIIKHAREMIRRGEIGRILFINAEYPQEWLLVPAEKQGSKQAAWRTDPALAGKSNSVGDLGSHIENMISYITGLKIKSLCARLDKIVEGRVLDDNATIMLEYEGGAKGVFWTSQIAAGYDNAFKFRIFGTKGAVLWDQEACNYLEVRRFGQPNAILSRGKDPLYPHAQSFSRIPSGHPEGYFEGLANIYKIFTAALVKQKTGGKLTEEDLDFPDGEMGADSVRFIGKCVESSEKGAIWVNY